VSNGADVLVDVTRDFAEQSRLLRKLDLVLLTHAHRDATGGLPALRRWWREHHGPAPIPVLASRDTIAAVRRRWRGLDHCTFRPVADGEKGRCGRWRLTALAVPHAAPPCSTYAWKLQTGATTIVYASDVACLTPELRRFCRAASLLVVDGAMWERPLFSHLTIDHALPVLATWSVRRIVLTQIGRTAPPHEELARRIRRLCARARPAYDGLKLTLRA
jgi:phosphoribosyl 1,2-cyclic phosphodiesterase